MRWAESGADRKAWMMQNVQEDDDLGAVYKHIYIQ